MRHKGESFLEKKKHYFEAGHTQFYVKFYDKGLQFGLLNRPLRFEVKYRTMEALNVPAFKTLADLKNKAILDLFRIQLLNKWNEVLLYDYTIRQSELKKVDKAKIIRFKNKNFWNDEVPVNRLDRPKKDLKRIVSEHSEDIQSYMSNQIDEHWKKQQKSCVTIDRLFGGVKPWDLRNE